MDISWITEAVVNLIKQAFDFVSSLPQKLGLPADLTELYIWAIILLGIYAIAEGAKKVFMVLGLIALLLAVIRTFIYLWVGH
jgi:hypothetical protein